MSLIYFFGFLFAIGLLFWSIRKKFLLSEEDLTLKKIFIKLINRGTDLIILVSSIYIVSFLFGFFGPEIEKMDNTSFTKLVLMIIFMGVIITSIIIFLKKIVGEKEMIFIYGLSFLIFALMINAKLTIFSEPEIYLWVQVFIGALFAIWFCSHWADKFQDALALPIGFLILVVGFLYDGYLKTGSWKDYLQEPQIIIFIITLLVLQFIFYKKVAWRRRIGYWGFMLPIFLFVFFQGLAIVALLWHGSLSLEELEYRCEVPQIVNLSVNENWQVDGKLRELKMEIAEIKQDKKNSENGLLPSEQVNLKSACEYTIFLGAKKLELAKKEASELEEKSAQDNSIFWAQKRLWQDIILPNYHDLKGGK